MIQFRCLCNDLLEVPADQAGGMIQCPRCKRLNDIPTLSDLANLDADGSFRLDALPLAPEPETEFVRKSTRAYTRSTVDDTGEEIDLRLSLDDFLNAGTRDAPREDADAFAAGAPKYDPMTGDLIEPLDVSRDAKADQPREGIPIARAAINYARGDTAATMSPTVALRQMFSPANLFVVLVMTIVSCMIHPFGVLAAAGLFIFVPVVFLMFASILAHFCNVIEEIGPGEFDELPRPLRDMSFSDDVWLPFVRFALSMMICFGPGAVITFNVPLQFLPVAAAMFGSIGVFFFPAVLLTASTSGAYNNLRPDRVFSVIRVTGAFYFIPLAMLVLGAPLYIGGLGASFVGLASMFGSGKIAWSFAVGGAGIGSMFAGLLLLHYGCWLLGLAYRAHHRSFEWVLQRFVSTRRHDTMRQLEIRRARNRRIAQTRTAAVGTIK